MAETSRGATVRNVPGTRSEARRSERSVTFVTLFLDRRLLKIKQRAQLVVVVLSVAAIASRTRRTWRARAPSLADAELKRDSIANQQFLMPCRHPLADLRSKERR